jgi:hypothetical protein
VCESASADDVGLRCSVAESSGRQRPVTDESSCSTSLSLHRSCCMSVRESAKASGSDVRLRRFARAHGVEPFVRQSSVPDMPDRQQRAAGGPAAQRRLRALIPVSSSVPHMRARRPEPGPSPRRRRGDCSGDCAAARGPGAQLQGSMARSVRHFSALSDLMALNNLDQKNTRRARVRSVASRTDVTRSLVLVFPSAYVRPQNREPVGAEPAPSPKSPLYCCAACG